MYILYNMINLIFGVLYFMLYFFVSLRFFQGLLMKSSMSGKLIDTRVEINGKLDNKPYDRHVLFNLYIYTKSNVKDQWVDIVTKSKKIYYSGIYEYNVDGQIYKYDWNQMFFRDLPNDGCLIFYNNKKPNLCMTSRERELFKKTALYMSVINIIYLLLMFFIF